MWYLNCIFPPGNFNNTTDESYDNDNDVHKNINNNHDIDNDNDNTSFNRLAIFLKE